MTPIALSRGLRSPSRARTISIVCAILTILPAPAVAQEFRQTQTDDYTRYELLDPESHSFRIFYDVSATTAGARFYFNTLRAGSEHHVDGVIDLASGRPLEWKIVSGADARAAGMLNASPNAEYLQVTLARPVPEGGQQRIRIDKTYGDTASYFRADDRIVFARSLGIDRNSVVLPAGYELVAVNFPSQVAQEGDGRIRVSFMNAGPASVPYRVEAKRLDAIERESERVSLSRSLRERSSSSLRNERTVGGVAQGNGSSGSGSSGSGSSGSGSSGSGSSVTVSLGNGSAANGRAANGSTDGLLAGDGSVIQQARVGYGVTERAFEDRDITYFLMQPETHSFRLYHDYTETRVGVDRYLNVVRAGSTVSDPEAVRLDTGEALRVETLRGDAIARRGLDVANVTAETEVVAIWFEPVPEGGSARLRITETYTDPGRYLVSGDELIWDRAFGRARNTVVLPDGWYVTANAVPAVVSQLEDGRIRLRFINDRPGDIQVFIKARRR